LICKNTENCSFYYLARFDNLKETKNIMIYFKQITFVLILLTAFAMQQSNVGIFLNESSNMPEIYGKTDSIKAVIAQGGVIDLNNNIYVIDQQIDIWRDSTTIQNGGFKRAATPVTYLSEPMDEGATYIVVDDASGFRKGQWLEVLTGAAYGQGDNDVVLHMITDIKGDTISFTNTQINSSPAGAMVIRNTHLLRINVATPTHIVIKNVVFDGNVRENNHTHDWRFNLSILSVRPGMTVDACTFMNTPAENIFQCGGVIKNCRYYKLGGSFVHWGCKSNQPRPFSLVENNSGRYSNLMGNKISKHSEGLFTFSSNSQNILVQGNTCENGKEAIMGKQGLEDYDVTVVNNYFKNFPRKIFTIVPGHPDSLDLSNNTFVNVPD